MVKRNFIINILVLMFFMNVLVACSSGGESAGNQTPTVENQAPVANAGADQTVTAGATVILDGSASSDVDTGDTLSYAWALARPVGSVAALSDQTVITPSFVTDVAGSYTATLVLNDGTVNSPLDSVTVTAMPPVYTIGGTVSGLNGTGLVLQNNAGDNLAISANGSFTFATSLTASSSYSVTVATQPGTPEQVCSVTNGSGTVASANVTDIAINCESTYTMGGTVSGLAGTGLVLQNNAGDDLAVSANGSFTFATSLTTSSAYSVSVLTQPGTPNQVCSVSNGSGTVASADVTNISISCTTKTYTVGGTVTGLTGSGLVLQNNAGDDLPITADGVFNFATALQDGSAYAVTVSNQPDSGQTCTVTTGTGSLNGVNVTNVDVSCATYYTVGGSVSGLSGSGLVLQNNGGDDLAVGANGAFAFATALADGASYDVTVLTQPGSPLQSCQVSAGGGTVASADVTSVSLTCTTYSYNIVDTNQTACYNSATGATQACSGAGYDADYTGHQPSYTVSGDTVTDSITALTWTQSTDVNASGAVDYNDKMTQSEADTYCTALTTGGLTWRLPTIKEMYSLILFSGKDASNYMGTDTSTLTPFIDGAFDWAFGDLTTTEGIAAGDRIIDGQYASSTLYVSTTMNGDATMFGVNFVDGRIKGYPIALKKFYVRCVTGNTQYGVNDFVDNTDQTISDNATGLMWQQNDSASTDWDNAVAVCEAATTAGHTDWRLPNAKELQSIVDYTRSPDTSSDAAINAIFNSTSFTNEEGVTDWGYYWASSTHVDNNDDGTNATYLSFGRALGYFNTMMLDVHGAGSQRSNDKQDVANEGGANSADIGFGTFYYHGPQGDILRLNNKVRCVRDI